MKFLGFLVASFMLIFCIFGIRIALDSGMLGRLRRREHFSSIQNHNSGVASFSNSESSPSQTESIFKILYKLSRGQGILSFVYRLAKVEAPLKFHLHVPAFLSALLDPPLVPPPKV